MIWVKKFCLKLNNPIWKNSSLLTENQSKSFHSLNLVLLIDLKNKQPLTQIHQSICDNDLGQKVFSSKLNKVRTVQTLLKQNRKKIPCGGKSGHLCQ